MTVQYLIKTFLLLLPFYISSEIIHRKPIRDNPYQVSDRDENSKNIAIAGYSLVFMMFAIHIVNKILVPDIISLKFGLLFLTMCVVCALYTFFYWHKVD